MNHNKNIRYFKGLLIPVIIAILVSILLYIVLVLNKSTEISNQPEVTEPMGGHGEALKVAFDDSLYVDENVKNMVTSNQNLKSYSDSELSVVLDEYLTAEHVNDNFHGAVMILKNGNKILNKGYGYSDIENKTAITGTTKFPIGSITKQFVAMAIMQLVEEGLIDIYDPLSMYIKDFPNSDSITIKDLLIHQSGIASFAQSNFELNNRIGKLPIEGRTNENIIEILKVTEPESPPGKEYTYNNSGYLILGYIVECVSGDSLSSYLKEYIFEEIGMKDTSPAYENGVRLFDTKGYMGYLTSSFQDTYDIDLITTLYGAGYLVSTTENLAKWSQALNSEQLVKRETLESIFTSYTPTMTMGRNMPYGYGYGWFVSYDSNKVMHDGSTDSFNSIITKYIYDGIDIIILSNKDYLGVDLVNMEENLYSLCQGKSIVIPEPKVEIAIEEDTLAMYEGMFVNEDFEVTVDIKIQNNQLFISFLPRELGLKSAALIPYKAGKFFSDTYKINIVYYTGENGRSINVEVSGYKLDFIEKEQ